jgi:hypothetical protein
VCSAGGSTITGVHAMECGGVRWVTPRVRGMIM